jgi:hypothetical protein
VDKLKGIDREEDWQRQRLVQKHPLLWRTCGTSHTGPQTLGIVPGGVEIFFFRNTKLLDKIANPVPDTAPQEDSF